MIENSQGSKLVTPIGHTTAPKILPKTPPAMNTKKKIYSNPDEESDTNETDQV
jgi:hypothetical protein